ncbi:hypothetical protein Q3G72_012463 [Acer saccharum]|nr:hypothetical protein Q3G72_012463 [Acer saccharum]
MMRNSEVHGSSVDSELDTFDWAKNFILHYSAASPRLSPAAAASSVCPSAAGAPTRVSSGVGQLARVDKIWKAPAQNLYKVNCDAALDLVRCRVGCGVVIRNAEGLVMAASSQRLVASFPPHIAEASAIRVGIQLAIDTGATTNVTNLMSSILRSQLARYSARIGRVNSFIVTRPNRPCLCHQDPVHTASHLPLQPPHQHGLQTRPPKLSPTRPATHSSLVPAVGSLHAPVTEKQVHALALKSGQMHDVFVGCSAFDMYSKTGLKEEASEENVRRNA